MINFFGIWKVEVGDGLSASILLDYNADPEIPDNKGASALQLAESERNEELSNLFLCKIESDKREWRDKNYKKKVFWADFLLSFFSFPLFFFLISFQFKVWTISLAGLLLFGAFRLVHHNRYPTLGYTPPTAFASLLSFVLVGMFLYLTKLLPNTFLLFPLPNILLSFSLIPLSYFFHLLLYSDPGFLQQNKSNTNVNSKKKKLFFVF